MGPVVGITIVRFGRETDDSRQPFGEKDVQTIAVPSALLLIGLSAACHLLLIDLLSSSRMYVGRIYDLRVSFFVLWRRGDDADLPGDRSEQ